MKKLITYIFPIYNEEGNIDKLYKQLLPELDKLKDIYDFEIICINDGSRDRSLDMLIDLHNMDSRFKVINFSRNFGHQMAITAGLDYAKGEAIIIMDADLQDPPAISLELIKKWEEGYEVVYAQRRTRKDTAFKKFTAYAFYRVLDKLANIRIPKDTGDFRLMDKKVVETIKQFREKNRFMRGMVTYVGFKQTGVLFDRGDRFAGTTNYPLKKMIKFAMDGIISFSSVPLQLISQIGYVITFGSILLSVILILIQIFFGGISQVAFIILAVFFIGGVQISMMGVLGLYIGRIFTEVLNRPLYIISSVYS